MVSSIAFLYPSHLHTFHALLLFILGYVIDVGHTGVQMEKYIAGSYRHPYNAVIVKKVLREINVISLSKSFRVRWVSCSSSFHIAALPSCALHSSSCSARRRKGSSRATGGIHPYLAFAFIQTIIFFSYVFP